MAVILPSVYKDGTATVSAGGTTVTGQGTLFTNSVLPGDFFGVHKGFAIRIASVNSNTSLTLANAWPGTAQTAAAYEIMLQSDMARVQESTRQLLEKLLGGNLDSFAGLTGAADKAPYFTGAGTMALADFKTKGRDIAASADMSGLLAKLGPVHGGPMPEPTNAGLGQSNGDFNTIVIPGVYTIAGTWANGPSGTATYTGCLEVFARSYNNAYWQILRLNTATWLRYTNTAGGTTWPDAWIRIANETVGTVSQSGGVPTGAVIERGSNANGEYVRFADGTQMCWLQGVLASGAIDSPSGSLFANAGGVIGWTFPIAFAGGGNTALVSRCGSSVRWGTAVGVSSTASNFRILSSASSATSLVFDVVAIGRWF